MFADISSLAHEEVLSEKVRAASQRSKIRDLHDLSEAAGREFDRGLLRSPAVVKLWESDQDNLDYAKFVAQVENAKDYDLNDLTNLLRRDQRPNPTDMIPRAKDGFRFLDQLTDVERTVTQDKKRSQGRSGQARRLGRICAAVRSHQSRILGVASR
jgi:Nucleotidyl transferase AbiEii toxin, Type IV TA system